MLLEVGQGVLGELLQLCDELVGGLPGLLLVTVNDGFNDCNVARC